MLNKKYFHCIDHPMFDVTNIQSYFSDGVIIFDVETTGLSAYSDEIIEIAAIKIDSQGQVHSFQSLVNPQMSIGEKTIKIHGITDEMVKNAPIITQVLKKFLHFIGDMPLIAHNAKYDVGFLFMALMRNRMDVPSCEVYDSCKIARLAYPYLAHHNLGFLTKELGIDLKNHHRAYADALATTELVQMSLTKINLDSRVGRVRSQSLIYSLDKFKKNELEGIPYQIVPLIPKITSEQIIEIVYDGGQHRGKFRPVKLIGILPVPYGLSLMAFCFIGMKNKSFLLKKITNYRFISDEEQKIFYEKII